MPKKPLDEPAAWMILARKFEEYSRAEESTHFGYTKNGICYAILVLKARENTDFYVINNMNKRMNTLMTILGSTGQYLWPSCTPQYAAERAMLCLVLRQEAITEGQWIHVQQEAEWE